MVLPLKALHHFDLRYNRLYCDAAPALAPLLAQCTSLTSLDLGDTELSIDGVIHLLPTLKLLPGLRKLDITGNGLLDAPVRRVCRQTVRSQASLQAERRLEVKRKRLQDSARAKVAEMLPLVKVIY